MRRSHEGINPTKIASTKTKKRISCVGHFLTAFSAITFLTGCLLLGYVAWILSTSVSIQKFQSGTLILTYILIGVGLTFFFTGLVGWVSGASESPCIIRMYIVLVVALILAAICLGLTAAALHIEFEDILRFGWMEVNQSTRNFFQSKLNCCGFRGPREFAENNYMMDSSCYEVYHGERRLKQASCSTELLVWFNSNKLIWLLVSISLLFVQFLSIGAAALSLHFISLRHLVAKKVRNDSRSSSNRQLYEDSEGISENFRDSL